MRPARADGNLRTMKVLSCQGRNCKFSFLTLSPWVLQLNGKTANLDFILIIVFLHSPSPERKLLANCTQVPLVVGSHPGERQVTSLDSASRACMGSASVRTSLNRIECTTLILRMLWRLVVFLTTIQVSTSSIVSIDGSCDVGIGDHGLHSSMKTGLFWPFPVSQPSVLILN